MDVDECQDNLVGGRFRTLGIVLLSEWDTLTFLCRHPASLGTASDLAPLIGYAKAEIATVLNSLEGLGLIKRSNFRQGRRLYQFSTPLEPQRHACLLELMGLAENRTGRLMLLKHLKGPLR